MFEEGWRLIIFFFRIPISTILKVDEMNQNI